MNFLFRYLRNIAIFAVFAVIAFVLAEYVFPQALSFFPAALSSISRLHLWPLAIIVILVLLFPWRKEQ